jgi:hypothetical protein
MVRSLVEHKAGWLIPPSRQGAIIGIEFGVAEGYFSPMRRSLIWIILGAWLALALSAPAATGKVIKVLPQFLDLKGRNSLTPSLYERDNYQVLLRQSTNQVSGMRFNVEWRAKSAVATPLTLRVELRGVARGDYPKARTLEKTVKPGGWLTHWAKFELVGAEYKEFGRVTAWRATLWEGDRLLSEQKSFLW